MQDSPVEKTTFETLHEFVAPAQRKLSKETWDYLMGGAETETTLERNRIAIDSIAFRPRVLRNVENATTRARVMGHELRLPVILAPIGSMQDMVAEGGVAPSMAAARFGAIHMLSSACAPGGVLPRSAWSFSSRSRVDSSELPIVHWIVSTFAGRPRLFHGSFALFQ